MRILITGLSTRAIAESAVKSDHQIVTLDYFGDYDQRALVENYALQRDFDLSFSAQNLLQASQKLDFEAVIYISNLENYPEVVEALAQKAILLGNTPATLRQVRDWRILRAFCREGGIAHPTTLLPGEEKKPGFAASDEAEAPSVAQRPADTEKPGFRLPPSCGWQSWLHKPVRSGGGHGIKPWAGEDLDEDHLLQAHLEGRPASAAFVADGKRSVVIGLTEQLIGREELGARGFAWCGNILPLEPGIATLRAVEALADQLTHRFGLQGVNGLDLVMVDDPGGGLSPFLVEVNPRYTGSMELVEWAYGLNIFSLHLEAMEGRLPDFSLAECLRSPTTCFGKGIVYARQAVTMPDTKGWREQGRRDIPFSGEKVETRHPICTVLAQAESCDECWNRLVGAADTVCRELCNKE